MGCGPDGTFKGEWHVFGTSYSECLLELHVRLTVTHRTHCTEVIES